MHRLALILALLAAAPALAGAAPGGSLAEAAAGAYRVEVERLSLAETRTLEGAGRAMTVQRACAIAVRIQASSPDELQAIAGIDPSVSAEDDTGLRLAARGGSLPSFSATAGPNESRQTLVLDAPDRRATRLRSVDGELVLYRTVTPARAEFDLTAEQAEQTQALGDARITLLKAESSGDECTVRLRVESVPGLVVTPGSESLQRAVPALTTRSGASVRTGRFSSVSGVSPQGVAYLDQRLTFRGLKEPPVKLIYDALLKSNPDRHVHFRLTDVPLPVDSRDLSAGALAGRGTPAVRAAGPLAASSGGAIAGAVRGAGAPGGGGRVSFGLSRQEPGGWSAIRWIDAPTDAGGVARITGLRPGRYRIRRAFTPAGATAPLPGRWQNAEVVATIVAGKETTLPPLQRSAR